jgi:hypothetical protein
MAKRGNVKVNQISGRAANMVNHKDSQTPDAGSMGLGDQLLNRFKFKKSLTGRG